MNDSRDLSALMLTWQSLLRKNMAGDWRNEGRGVRGWFILTDSLPVLRCGNGVDGKKLFLMGPKSLLPPLMLPRGALAAGDAKERDRALTGEMRAGPSGEGLVGPTSVADVSVKERYHGFSESKWWDTVKANLEEEQEPTFAVDLIDEGSNRRDEALG